jgi:4'-phosphopantetheinyl transferase EntD
LIERLLPDVVACAEATQDTDDVALFPEEELSVGRAVDKRRREFITGRACARRALTQLGAPVTAIPNGPQGEPLWPAGVVGSITHCAGYRACAVARADDVIALGIDAEPNAALPDGVFEEVLAPGERGFVASATDGSGAPDLGRLLFSAKEAVYKAWFPLMQTWLDFTDAELSVDLAAATFRARLLVPGPVLNGVQRGEFHGRWLVEDGIICTAVVVM